MFRSTLAFTLAALPGLHAQPVAPAAIPLPAVEVTGTRLGRPLADSPIASTVITREMLENSGRARLGELLRELPEFSGNPVTDTVAFNEARGVSGFDLRGLGNGKTLILVNGRRTTVNANAFEFITTYVDLNRFSPAFIERIEILKSGASAVYGADAVGGVVNLITRRRPSGGEATIGYGNTFKTDAAELTASLATGATRGRLGFSVGVDYFRRNAQAHVDRYFSRTSDLTPRYLSAYDYYAKLPAKDLSIYDGRLLNGPRARISVAPGQTNGRNGVDLPGVAPGAAITELPGTGGVVGGTLASGTPNFSTPFLAATGGRFNAAAAATFVAPELTAGDPNARNRFDRNPLIWTLPEASRLGAISRLDYETAGGIAMFAEASGGQNRSRTEYHPRDFKTVAPRTNAFNPFGVDVEVEWRIPDQERRRTLTTNEFLSTLWGVRSPTGSAIKWEAATSYSRDEYRDTTTGLYRWDRTRAALASANPATALNPFGGGDYRQPAALIADLAVTPWFGGMADLLLFDVNASGQLLRLPAGPLQVSIFAEQRRERLTAVSDPDSRAGNIVGAGLTGADARHRREVWAVAAEAAAPLVGARPGPDRSPRLALEAAARVEDFSRSFNSGIKPSLGIVARPTPDLVLRTSYALSFRAPTLPQLFLPQSDTFFNSVPDPRRPPALTGDGNDGPNVPRLVRQGGNPNLGAETGRSLQVGTVWSPRAAAGFSFEATWFRYDLDDLISSISPTYVLDNELGGLGSLVQREPSTQSFVNRTDAPISVLTGPNGQTTAVAPGQNATVPGRLTRVDIYTINLSRRRLEGWDFGARHAGELAGGRLTGSANVSYTDFTGSAYDRRTPMVNQAGRAGAPRWRGRTSLDWTRGVWSTGATLNYIASSGPHETTSHYQKPYRTVHLRVAYAAPQKSWLRGTQIAVGLDDVFDEDPPLFLDHPIGFNYATIPRPQGRFWRVTLKRTW